MFFFSICWCIFAKSQMSKARYLFIIFLRYNRKRLFPPRPRTLFGQANETLLRQFWAFLKVKENSIGTTTSHWLQVITGGKKSDCSRWIVTGTMNFLSKRIWSRFKNNPNGSRIRFAYLEWLWSDYSMCLWMAVEIETSCQDWTFRHKAFVGTRPLIHKHVKMSDGQVDFGNHLFTQICRDFWGAIFSLTFISMIVSQNKIYVKCMADKYPQMFCK